MHVCTDSFMGAHVNLIKCAGDYCTVRIYPLFS